MYGFNSVVTHPEAILWVINLIKQIKKDGYSNHNIHTPVIGRRLTQRTCREVQFPLGGCVYTNTTVNSSTQHVLLGCLYDRNRHFARDKVEHG